MTAVEQIVVRDDNGTGAYFTVDFENNYLPNVVRRENGAASFEALKAQAVAARTFAYYKFDIGTTYLRNSQADQVYSLGGVQSNPGGLWEQAVRETEGEILTFNETVIASFYVAGARPTSSSYIAAAGDYDGTDTERFVTYTYANGLVGPYNTGSSLGFEGTVTNPNYRNRGAMSQNGADEQSDDNVHYYDILKFYYGGDIQLGLVDQAVGQTPFGVKTLANFERNSDMFNRSLTYAGQTRNLTSSSSATRSTAAATAVGGTSQRLAFDYDESADQADGTTDGFFARHLSSVSSAQRLTNLTSGTITNPAADPIGNVVLPTQGTIGFWLMAEPTAADLSVAIAIDDFGLGSRSTLDTTTEQSSFKQILADGNWYKYEWALDSAGFESAFGSAGDGELDARFTLDSILFRGFGDAVVYLDDVFFDTVGTVPEPTSLSLMLLSLVGGLRRPNRRKES